MAKPRNARTGFAALNPSTRTGSKAQLLTVSEVKTLEDGRVLLIGTDEANEEMKVVNPVGTASDKDFDPDMVAGTQIYVRSKSKEGEYTVAEYTRAMNTTPDVARVIKAAVSLKMPKNPEYGPRVVIYGTEQAVKITGPDDITEEMIRGLIDSKLLPADNINNRKILIQLQVVAEGKTGPYTKQQVYEISVATKQDDGTFGVPDVDARIAEMTEQFKAAVEQEIENSQAENIVFMPVTSIWGSKFMTVIPASQEGKKPRKFSAADDFVTSVYLKGEKKRILRDEWKEMVEKGTPLPADLIKNYGVLEVYGVVKASYDQEALKKAAQDAGLKLQYFKLQTDPKKINANKLAQALVDAGVDVRAFRTGWMIDNMESVTFPKPVGKAYLESAVHKPDLPKFDAKTAQDHEEHDDHAADESHGAADEEVPEEAFPDEIGDLDDVLGEDGPAPK